MESPSTDLRVDRAVLAESDPATLAWAVIEPAYNAVSFYDGPEAFAVAMRALTPGQRALLALHWCVAEVSNGGFDQFFFNPTALLAPDAVEGFRRIGVPEAADLVTRAREIFADRPPPPAVDDPAFDEAEDADAFEAYQDRHRPLEDRFFALARGELYRTAAGYVRQHAEEFVR
jgi:hypothetical protein